MPADALAGCGYGRDRPAYRVKPGASRHQQRAHAVAAGFLRIGSHLDCEQPGRSGALETNETLPLITHPALLDGGRPGVRFLSERTVVAPADIGIGIAPREGEMIFFVCDKLRQKTLALLIRHQLVESLAQHGGLPQGHGKVHVARGEFFEHDAGGQTVRARPAGFFRQRQCAQAHL